MFEQSQQDGGVGESCVHDREGAPGVAGGGQQSHARGNVGWFIAVADETVVSHVV